MTKNVALSTLLCSAFISIVHSLEAVKIDIRQAVGVSTCTGARARCSVTINAVGDIVIVDIKDAPIKDVGTLDKEEVKTIALPETPGTHAVYSFTPSSGDLAGTKIYLLVQNEEQRRGTRRADMQVFKFSRQLPGDRPDQWIEIGDIAVAKTVPLSEYPFTVKQDGTFETYDTKNTPGTEIIKIDTTKPLPEGVEKVTLHIGTKDLTPQN